MTYCYVSTQIDQHAHEEGEREADDLYIEKLIAEEGPALVARLIAHRGFVAETIGDFIADIENACILAAAGEHCEAGNTIARIIKRAAEDAVPKLIAGDMAASRRHAARDIDGGWNFDAATIDLGAQWGVA